MESTHKLHISPCSCPRALPACHLSFCPPELPQGPFHAIILHCQLPNTISGLLCKDTAWQSSCLFFTRPLGPFWNNMHMLWGQRPAFILRGGLGSKQSPLTLHIYYSGLLDHKWPFGFLRLGLWGALYTKPKDLNYSLSNLTIRTGLQAFYFLLSTKRLGHFNPFQENVKLVPIIMI